MKFKFINHNRKIIELDFSAGLQIKIKNNNFYKKVDYMVSTHF